MQAKPGAVEVHVSSDRRHWKAVGRGGDVAAGEWQTLAVDGSARYVRFVFVAEGKKARLGHLAEVEIYGPPAAGGKAGGKPESRADEPSPASATADDGPAPKALDGKGRHGGRRDGAKKPGGAGGQGARSDAKNGPNNGDEEEPKTDPSAASEEERPRAEEGADKEEPTPEAA